jgi:hypothetical protein
LAPNWNPSQSASAIAAKSAWVSRSTSEAEQLRNEVLAIPTRSPQGLLIKLAIAVESKSTDTIEADAPNSWASAGEDLLPHLAAALRAMMEGAT